MMTDASGKMMMHSRGPPQNLGKPDMLNETEAAMVNFLQDHSFGKYIGDEEIAHSVRKMRRRLFELQRSGAVVPSARSRMSASDLPKGTRPARSRSVYG